jgi:hypothetical protein
MRRYIPQEMKRSHIHQGAKDQPQTWRFLAF